MARSSGPHASSSSPRSQRLRGIAAALTKWGEFCRAGIDNALKRSDAAKDAARTAMTLMLADLRLLNECRELYGCRPDLEMAFTCLGNAATWPDEKDLGECPKWCEYFTKCKLWGGEQRSFIDEVKRWAGRVNKEEVYLTHGLTERGQASGQTADTGGRQIEDYAGAVEAVVSEVVHGSFRVRSYEDLVEITGDEGLLSGPRASEAAMKMRLLQDEALLALRRTYRECIARPIFEDGWAKVKDRVEQIDYQTAEILNEKLQQIRWHCNGGSPECWIAYEYHEGVCGPSEKLQELIRSFANGLRCVAGKARENGPGQTGDQERHVEVNRTDSIRLPEYSIGQTTSKWAEIFQCSPSTILRRIKKGEWTAKRDGRKWRLRLDQLPAEYVQKAIQK